MGDEDDFDLMSGTFYMAAPLPAYRPDIRNWASVILVATPRGLSHALGEGWQRKQILVPDIRSLARLRWRRLVMTWEYVTEPVGSDMYRLIESHQRMYNAQVCIDQIRPEKEIWHDEP